MLGDLLRVTLRAEGINRRLSLIVAADNASLPQGSQQTRSGVQSHADSLSHLRASGVRSVTEELHDLRAERVLLKLCLRGLRGTIGVTLRQHLDLMVDKGDLISVSQVGTDSNEHLSLSHRDSSFCGSTAYNRCYQILMPFSSGKALFQWRFFISLTF